MKSTLGIRFKVDISLFSSEKSVYQNFMMISVTFLCLFLQTFCRFNDDFSNLSVFVFADVL